MQPSVDIWWTSGLAAEPAAALPTVPRTARRLTAVPPEWRRGRRGRFLHSVAEQCRKGAPDWSAKGAARGWRFNLSAGQHLSLTDSGTCLIVAVGRGTPIGIDAERIRPVDEAVATIARLGLGRQAEILTRLPPAARQRAFAHLWTAFEAFLKLERLPWDAAAARFAAFQDKWQIGMDGMARFHGEAAMGLVFQPVSRIPGIFLTVASPVPCRVAVREWQCDLPAMAAGKLRHPHGRELRPAGKSL